MKEAIVNILSFQERDLFEPIRDKTGFIKVLMLCCRYLLMNQERGSDPGSAKVKMTIGGTSRLFVFNDNKDFSVGFPFGAFVGEDGVESLQTWSGDLLNPRVISAVLSIVNDGHFRHSPSLLDYFMGHEGEDLLGLRIVEELFHFEPSYIRYDRDPEHENGHLHPLYHLDVNYSQKCTYKLGLDGAISVSLFEDIYNTATDCYYLRPARK